MAFTVQRDSSGNLYVECDGVRITYIFGRTRKEALNWCGCDALRVQAYQNPMENKAMHFPVEIPIPDDAAILDFFTTVLVLKAEARNQAQG